MFIKPRQLVAVHTSNSEADDDVIETEVLPEKKNSEFDVCYLWRCVD